MSLSPEFWPVTPWKVVIIDDDPFVLRVHAEMLRLMGHATTTFECPKEALGYLQENSNDVDLVVTDYQMPEINGLELIRRLREAGCDLPSMILTAYIYEVDGEQAKAIDARVVSKPIPMKLFAAHIHAFQQG